MFWASSFNMFIFRYGPMGPTIADASALLGLLPHGEYFGPENTSDAEFTYPEVEVKGKNKTGKTKYISAYKTWLQHFKGQ